MTDLLINQDSKAIQLFPLLFSCESILVNLFIRRFIGILYEIDEQVDLVVGGEVSFAYTVHHNEAPSLGLSSKVFVMGVFQPKSLIENVSLKEDGTIDAKRSSYQ